MGDRAEYGMHKLQQEVDRLTAENSDLRAALRLAYYDQDYINSELLPKKHWPPCPPPLSPKEMKEIADRWNLPECERVQSGQDKP